AFGIRRVLSCNRPSSSGNGTIRSKSNSGSDNLSGRSAQNISQGHICKDHEEFGFGSDSSSTLSSVSWTSSIEASSMATSTISPSPLATPTSEVDPKHNELMMLKHEAFQELASQTQRFDDLFVAKMIYWESLGAEEKAQWLERSQHRIDGQDNASHGTEEVEMDELINALDCRATCKDYSALIAFEKQGEIERRKCQMAE
ncbi:hypothetical protein BGX27_007013, partial [Mortierella sp. AM989]